MFNLDWLTYLCLNKTLMVSHYFDEYNNWTDFRRYDSLGTSSKSLSTHNFMQSSIVLKAKEKLGHRRSLSSLGKTDKMYAFWLNFLILIVQRPKFYILIGHQLRALKMSKPQLNNIQNIISMIVEKWKISGALTFATSKS